MSGQKPTIMFLCLWSGIACDGKLWYFIKRQIVYLATVKHIKIQKVIISYKKQTMFIHNLKVVNITVQRSNERNIIIYFFSEMRKKSATDKYLITQSV